MDSIPFTLASAINGFFFKHGVRYAVRTAVTDQH